MTTSTIKELADRVAVLEREVARLLQQRVPQLKKGWRYAVGMYGDDPGMRELVELGKQLRDAEQPDVLCNLKSPI